MDTKFAAEYTPAEFLRDHSPLAVIQAFPRIPLRTGSQFYIPPFAVLCRAHASSHDLNQFNASNGGESLINGRHSFSANTRRLHTFLFRQIRGEYLERNFHYGSERHKAPFQATSSIGFHYFYALHRPLQRSLFQSPLYFHRIRR